MEKEPSIYDVDKLIEIITDYRTRKNINLRNFIEKANISYALYHQIKRKDVKLTSRIIKHFANAMEMDFYVLWTQIMTLSDDENKNELLHDTFKTLFLLNDEQLQTIHDEVKRMASFK